jgi:hypothetical protein
MNKEFIPYEQSVDLKELGFDEPCFGYYEPSKEFIYLNWEIFKDLPYLAKNSEWQDLCGAPTFSQAFRWFRDSLNYHHYIEPIHRDGKVCYEYCVVDSSKDEKQFNEDDIVFTYEEAELACIIKYIDIIKNKFGSFKK